MSDAERVLRALAAFFAEERDAILRKWRLAAQNDPQLGATGSALSQAQFYDHIPAILDALQQGLREPAHDADGAAKEHDAAVRHGAQRWRQGYGQRALIREWRHLHLILVETVEQFAATQPSASQPALSRARLALADLLSDAIASSVDQFDQLQRADATGRTHALEHALAQLGTIETQRAAIWHQAAHDLRGSLSVVRNVGEMLTQPGSAAGEPARPLVVLQRAVESMHALLNDLLNLARLEAGHEQLTIAPFDAARMLAELCDGLRPLADSRKLVLSTSGPAALAVEGDRVKTYRIAQNLINNAIRYTEHGGVAVRWCADPAAPETRWLLQVQDTGPGLPAEFLGDSGARREENVAAANADREGIGLSIVRRMCELLQVRLESRSAGTGTEFSLWFPRRYAAADGGPAAPRA